MFDEPPDYMDDEQPFTALDEVMTVVNQLQQQRQLIASAEDQLGDLKKVEERLSREVVPQMLDNHGVASIKLDNGVTVEVKEDVKASVPKDVGRRANGLRWMCEQGAGALIKDKLTIEDPPEWLIVILEERGVAYGREKDVNAASLAAWFREKFGIKKGTVASMEVSEVSPDISCFRYRETKIKERT
jgi:hypothetical protein